MFTGMPIGCLIKQVFLNEFEKICTSFFDNQTYPKTSSQKMLFIPWKILTTVHNKAIRSFLSIQFIFMSMLLNEAIKIRLQSSTCIEIVEHSPKCFGNIL